MKSVYVVRHCHGQKPRPSEEGPKEEFPVIHGIAATFFQKASLLDAFGVYSNYRNPSAKLTVIGAEAFGDESQMMFYQDRYLVRVEVSGTPN